MNRMWRKHRFYYLAVLAVIVTLALVSMACSSDQQASPEASPTFQPSPDIQESTPVPAPTPSNQEMQALTPLSDEEQRDLMYRLLIDVRNTQDVSAANSAVSEILALRDQSFVPVLMELLPLPFTSAHRQFNVEVVLPALRELTGQELLYDLIAWREWLGRQADLTVPESFAEWKGDLFGVVDPRFKDFFVDRETGMQFPQEKTRLDLTKINWGGVLKDDGSGISSIPALVNPTMVSPEEANYLRDHDRVFGVSINGDVRAYPLRIMNWHEMANDVVGGKPVALAYCTLCGAGILYDATFHDTIYTFRTSGLLYISNKLMYDLNTNTLWNQFNGQPVLGVLADSGIKLDIIPITLTTWGEWLSSHPETKVLDIETEYVRNYASEGDPGAAYTAYFASPNTMFPVAERDDRLETKALIYGLEINNEYRAYPIDELKKEPVVSDALGGVNVVLVTEPTTGAVRAYEMGNNIFVSLQESDGATLVLDDEGKTWTVEESALVNVAVSEEVLPRIPGHTAFWFGWYAFHPETTVYGVD